MRTPGSLPQRLRQLHPMVADGLLAALLTELAVPRRSGALAAVLAHRRWPSPVEEAATSWLASYVQFAAAWFLGDVQKRRLAYTAKLEALTTPAGHRAGAALALGGGRRAGPDRPRRRRGGRGGRRPGPQPSPAHLESLTAAAREAGLPVEVVVEGEPRPLPAGVDLSPTGSSRRP